MIKDNVLKKYNGNAEEVVIPDGVEKIGEYAFSSHKSLKKVTIPSSVKEIGGIGSWIWIDEYWYYNGAFDRCESLEQVVLSEGLELIGAFAFYNCKSLGSIVIPASVKKIGQYAFDLKSIVFEGNAPKIGKNAFGKVEAIYAPKASAADFSQYKEAYLIGFLQMLKEGVAIEENIIEKNKKNIKLNAKKLCETKNEELFVYMLQNALLPLNVVDELITKYNKEKNLTRIAALIDYKDKNFTEKQKEEQFNKQFEVRELTVTELRKDWAIVKKMMELIVSPDIKEKM